jgi:hypothetical protein
MAVTHSVAARNTATDSVTLLINASGAGKLVFRISPSTVTATGAAVATLTFSTTAFGASASGTANANPITSDTNAAGNASQIAYATFETSAGTVILQCAVAGSGSDINMSGGLTVAAGDTITCTSLTYTALAA